MVCEKTCIGESAPINRFFGIEMTENAARDRLSNPEHYIADGYSRISISNVDLDRFRGPSFPSPVLTFLANGREGVTAFAG